MGRADQDFLMAAAEEAMQEEILERQLNNQLHNEIQAQLRKADGVGDSPLYQWLPPEIRHEIYSYIVVVPTTVHVFAPYDNDDHGFRLSLCDDSALHNDFGQCACEKGRPYSRAVQSDFMDTALLLVSKSVRREVLDVLFTRNHFAFTSLSDLMRFSTLFRTSASKMQHLRIFERADDYPCAEYTAKALVKSRKRIGTIQTLDLRVFLCDWTQYEKPYEDGYINELVHFSVPPPDKITCKVRSIGRLSRRSEKEIEMAARIEEKLLQVFSGTFESPDKVPMDKPPKPKVRDEDKPLANKKGIIALWD